MLYLWIFGNNVEDRLGRIGFLLFYLVGGIIAALAQVAIDPGSTQPLVGASGAIAAALGAYIVLFPRARILSLVFLGFFYQLLNVPALVVLGFWFVLQLISGFGSLGGEPLPVGSRSSPTSVDSRRDGRRRPDPALVERAGPPRWPDRRGIIRHGARRAGSWRWLSRASGSTCSRTATSSS